MINPMVIAGLSLLCSDGNPGRGGGCWLYAEASRQAVKRKAVKDPTAM